jgi:hypothetical protein
MSAGSSNNNRLPSRWKDDIRVYPKPEVIAEALQDEGKQVKVVKKGKEEIKHKFPAIEKLANQVYTNIRNLFKPEGLTQNVTRGRVPLYQEIVLNRRHMDLSEQHPFFKDFCKDGRKVFLIHNNPENSGLDRAIDKFQDYVISQLQQKMMVRTSNDGLRLGGIMLNSKYRKSVSILLSKKKDRRSMSDIPGDHAMNFFEEILVDVYLNPQYVVEPPASRYYDEFPEEEKGSWDPNDTNIFQHQRTAAWLKGTWEDYIRPKYKKALDKWNKDTGGGDGNPTEFVNFCGSDRWLVYLYCKDIETNCLLACSAGGRMPKHLQLESGFESSGGGDMSSLGEESSPGTSKRTASLEDEASAAKRSREKLTSTMEKVVEMIAKGQNATHDDEQDIHINKMAEYSEMMVDENEKILNTMTPNSKDKYVDALKKKRKERLDKI